MGRKPTLLARTIADRIDDPGSTLMSREFLEEFVQRILNERARILKDEETARTVRPEPKERWITQDGERRLISGN